MARSELILRLAGRNLVLNARRSALVGSLIVLAVVIAVIGGSVFEGTVAGLRRTFINSFTGDLFVSPKSTQPLSLFGVNTPIIGQFARIPAMVDHAQVLGIVRHQPGVAAAVSQISGYALLQTGGTSLPVALFGVNGSSYFKAFTDLRLAAGKALVSGERGIMITKSQADEIGGSSGKALALGDLIKLTAFTSSGFTIRQVPLRGVFEFPVKNAVLDRIAYVDSGTLRSLTGMIQGSGQKSRVPEADKRYLTGNLNDVFGSGNSTVTNTGPGVSLSDVVSALSDTKARNRAVAQTNGAWSFILVKLRPGVDPAGVERSLRSSFAAHHLNVVVGDWRAAAGTGAALAGALSLAFNVGLLLLAVVIVFVLVNTMIIWVNQRIGEIGTIRAIGGSRGFVVRLFVAESALLSVIAGLAGIAIGSAIVLWLAHRGLAINNRVLELVFGGTRLRPVLTLKTLAVGFLGALAVGGVGTIFPLRLALKVRPVRAMDSE